MRTYYLFLEGKSINPLGDFFGYLLAAVSAHELSFLANLADLVNEIGFCLATWSSARTAQESPTFCRRDLAVIGLGGLLYLFFYLWGFINCVGPQH